MGSTYTLEEAPSGEDSKNTVRCGSVRPCAQDGEDDDNDVGEEHRVSTSGSVYNESECDLTDEDTDKSDTRKNGPSIPTVKRSCSLAT